jgi:hypothetical protein
MYPAACNALQQQSTLTYSCGGGLVGDQACSQLLTSHHINTCWACGLVLLPDLGAVAVLHTCCKYRWQWFLPQMRALNTSTK